MTNSWLRFLSTSLLLASTAVGLRVYGDGESIPKYPPLESFPAQLGPWRGTDLDIDPDTREKLKGGELLSRAYIASSDQIPGIELFIAYFPSQKTGDTIHSPLHCLPGAGWEFVTLNRVTINVPGHGPFPANRAVIAQGEQRDLVLYWYWAHDRGVASEYWAKYYLVKDSIQMRRSDGGMVRVITPLYPGESADSAYQRMLPFAADIVPLLNDYIPRYQPGVPH